MRRPTSPPTARSSRCRPARPRTDASRRSIRPGERTTPRAASDSWELEISLDLDAVSALCPNCHIVLVEANSAGISDLAAAQTEASQQGASTISDSWEVQMTGPNAAQVFSSYGSFTFPGITTVAASGDTGYPGSSTNDFPAALGGVTAAGGTTLAPSEQQRSAERAGLRRVRLGRQRVRVRLARDQAHVADRYRVHRPVLQRPVGRRRSPHRHAGVRLRRRWLGGRGRDERGDAPDRGLLRSGGIHRPRSLMGIRERRA